MKLGDADEGHRKGYAVLCGLISLPFHYVFWLSLYQWVRDRPSVSPTTMSVVIAMGLAAFALTYFAYALYASRPGSSEARLPNLVLYIASAVLAANAVYQFATLYLLAGVESLAVSVGAFLLARSRGR